MFPKNDVCSTHNISHAVTKSVKHSNSVFYLACLFFLSHITFVINEENIVEIIFTTTHLCFHVCFVELLLMKSYLPRGGAASE